MISKVAKKYCCEPLDRIENYEEAIQSNRLYVIHHRREDEGYSVRELRKLKLYWRRPASELVFMERSEHLRHHNTGNGNWLHGMPQEKHPQFIHLDEDAIILEDEKHTSYRELARKFGVSSQTIRRRLKKLGLHHIGGHENIRSRYKNLSQESEQQR